MDKKGIIEELKPLFDVFTDKLLEQFKDLEHKESLLDKSIQNYDDLKKGLVDERGEDKKRLDIELKRIDDKEAKLKESIALLDIEFEKQTKVKEELSKTLEETKKKNTAISDEQKLTSAELVKQKKLSGELEAKLNALKNDEMELDKKRKELNQKDSELTTRKDILDKRESSLIDRESVVSEKELDLKIKEKRIVFEQKKIEAGK